MDWQHIYPNNDWIEHKLEGLDCVCEPRSDWQNMLVIHNSADGREKKEEQMNDIEKRYTYHAPKEGQPEKYVAIRNLAKDLAYLVDQLCPDSREKSTSLTKLDEVMMFAIAAIARNE